MRAVPGVVAGVLEGGGEVVDGDGCGGVRGEGVQAGVG